MLGQMVSSSVCYQCNGSGKIIDNKPPGVDSTGLHFKEEILKINIPSGVADGAWTPEGVDAPKLNKPPENTKNLSRTRS